MIEVFVYVDKDGEQHIYTTMLKYKHHKKMFMGVYNNLTTNEAILKALEYTIDQVLSYNYAVKIYTSSKYINDVIRFKWYEKWELNGWITNDGTQVKYRDIWIDLLDNLTRFNNIRVVSPIDRSNDNWLQCKYKAERIKEEANEES